VAEDGTIEAIRHRTARGWVRGIQWHPEDNAASNEGQQRLLAAFVAVARDHRQTDNTSQGAS
jgi:putative glutamine amidotransferase